MKILIPAGQTRVNFNVPVTIDGIFEGAETFNMRLDALSSVENLVVEVGTLTNAIGQITDAGILSIKLFFIKSLCQPGGLSYVIITCTQHCAHYR